MPDAPDMPGWCRFDTGLAVAKIHITGGADVPGRLAAALGIDTPAPNRFTGNDDIALAAIAPGEWLLTGSGESVTEAMRRAEGIEDATVLAIDLTHGRTALRLEGPEGRDWLAAFTPLDLRPERLPTGAAVRTRLADIGVFIARTGEAPAFLLIVDQSYASHLRHLLS
ncbi:sarcosine oxidase subunit gamma [Sphingosinicella soli]|uniref:Sarcosine oxidase subunit gamma n=1 Tax=Sphingosinicella soli TaxID=333708 RepID=A0A7W7F7M9_9SPHN|nr:sarcosine oxidase subunit gamma family protein [Sphingosinicella soli]MBB4632854.1 sarcosine oxidase subunit gamma [Sphingosinicella soli]